jgi:hypothetical protein
MVVCASDLVAGFLVYFFKEPFLNHLKHFAIVYRGSSSG